MEKYPVIIYAGAALLGKVGGEMVMTDPFIAGRLHPSRGAVYLVEAACAAVVIIVGWVVVRRDMARQTAGR
jgi:predicted tellurium resistance membrane protein TerC